MLLTSKSAMAFCRGSKQGVVWLMMTVAVGVMQTSLCQAKTTLEDHGYKGVVVVIDHVVSQDKDLLTKLEESLTEAFEVLFRATRNLLYFEEFVIVIPQNWLLDVNYSNAYSFEVSREKILISSSKSEYGDNPYVKRDMKCGKAGLFMHLTPLYLKNDSVIQTWGPREKVIVHEWGHLRWGLFDEYAKTDTQKKYEKHGTEYQTMCTEDKFETKVTGKIGSDFTPVTSLMFAPYKPSIVEFCDHPSSPDKSIRHNTWAAHDQNSQCNYRSAWEVMREHSDFKQNLTSLESFAQTRPIQFKYVQVQSSRRVLVLDTSGSMGTDEITFAQNRLTKITNVVKEVILTWVETDSSLGIVRFSESATVFSEVVTVSTEADRRTLISRLPTSASGSTSIGAGLRKALEILEKGMDSPWGGTIILISDGEENRRPWIQEVLPEILERSVVVHSIGVTQNAARLMSNLSSSTGGKSFFESGDRNSTALIDSFAAIFASSGLTHDPSIPLLLQSEAGIVSTDAPLTGSFYVDSTVGKNTTVTVSFTKPVSVNLTGPGNVTISLLTHPQLYVTGISGILRVLLSDYMENGMWTYWVTASELASDVVISVQSSARTYGSDVIQVRAWLPEENNLVFALDRKLGLYAEVTRGRSSVLNSQVVALVERPKSEGLRIALLDNGVGSDIIKDDGIYSAYILAKDLTGDGRYSIKIQVEGVEGVTGVVVGGRGRSSAPLAVNTIESIEQLETEEVGRFQRVMSAGEFSVNGFPENMTSVPDLIPPSRITNLAVIRDEGVDEVVKVEWTSIGGDMDRGTAASYTFYFTTDLDVMLSRDSNVPMWSEVNETYLRDLKPPQPAGNTERVKVDLALLGDNDTLFLCLRATDESGNAGDLSNVVSITRLRKLPEVDVPRQVRKVNVGPEMMDVKRDAGFYVLVTLLPVLAVLALVVTCLLLAMRRSRKRKSFHVHKKMDETAKSTESPSKSVEFPNFGKENA